MYPRLTLAGAIIKLLEEFDNEMEKHFEERTNYHISLVRKYCLLIQHLNDPRIDNSVLEEESKTHDQSKFEPPEYEPYLHVNWKYKLQKEGKVYKPTQEIMDQMNIATFHHITHNPHHPDAWDPNLTMENLNTTDRDKPAKMVDATHMPLSYVACMVADWLAMDEEKGTDPYEWCRLNINKRWEFTNYQIKLIYDLIEKLWR